MPDGQNGIVKQSEVGLRILIVAAILGLFGKVFIYDRDTYATKNEVPAAYASKGMLLSIKNDLQEDIKVTRRENYDRLCDRMSYIEEKMTKLAGTIEKMDDKIDKVLMSNKQKKP
jgi:hypothetical protein